MNSGLEALHWLVGSPPFAMLGRWATRHQLRIVCYHGVGDRVSFGRQINYLVRKFNPVGAEEIVLALAGEVELPLNAVWVTFDDGDPSVIDLALPILHSHGVAATLFVCPGVIDTNRPFWWQVVEKAHELGIRPNLASLDAANPTATYVLAALKSLSDQRRREQVTQLAARIEEKLGAPFTTRQLSSQELMAFVDHGGTVGNHSWDHPLLDQCSEDEQRRQIITAHRWLAQALGSESVLFAFPNGNATPESLVFLRDLGYKALLLFDHRLVKRLSTPVLSRLRVNGDASLHRFRSIVSGIHPWLHTVRSSG